MIKNLLSSLLMLLFVSVAWAQAGQGGIKGKVIDEATGEPLPFANVVVKKGGVMVTGGITEMDGSFQIKPLSPGTYSVELSMMGYGTKIKEGVKVTAEGLQFVNFTLSTDAELLKTVVVEGYKVPLIDKGNTTSSTTVDGDAMKSMPARSATDIAKLAGGVYSKDDGSGSLSIRGSRSDANYYYIDGIKVRGTSSLPQSAIEQVSVITGGLPAQYGDVTGGVISITTRGPSAQYFGGLEYLTSGYKIGDDVYGTDKFAYNLAEFSLAGPLLMKEDTAGKKKPLIGFFISGNYNNTVDSRPTAIGNWVIKDDYYNELVNNPLVYSTTGTGTFQSAEFLRMDAFENVPTRPGAEGQALNLTGKLDINTGELTNLTFGGTYNWSQGSNYSYRNSVYNSHNNGEYDNNTWRVFGRFTQRFGSNDPAKEEKSSRKIKNAFYQLQVDYNQTNSQTWDKNHKDDAFKYGYVGEFKTYQARQYSDLRVDTIYDGRSHGYGQDTVALTGYWQETFEDTLIGFTPSDINPELSKYTENYYELYGWEGYDENGDPVFDPFYQDFLSRVVNIQTNGGLLNGNYPQSIYGLWYGPANGYNGIAYSQSNQFRVSLMGSANIGDHALQLGFEYEQRVDRAYSIAPSTLWGIGYQYTNNHILNIDRSVSTIDYSSSYPTISYERLNASPGDYQGEVGGDNQAFFDYNLRKSLGLDPDGTDFVDFYNLSPDQLSVDFFSADELLSTLNRGSNPAINYYGYDPYGNAVKETVSLDDFFNDINEYGNYTRGIDAFRPTYVAGFIQDKFSIDDLNFNVGLRVDRYDANQQVLKDPYSLFPLVNAGESEAQQIASEMDGYSIPGNIGDDYAVYVNDIQNPTEIVGYRNGRSWYDANGNLLVDSDPLQTANGIAPLLVDKENTNSEDITSAAFEDYKPQINIMPRIAFSFSISEDALFFAHYDVLTKRPTTGARLNPLDYYYLQSRGTSYVVSNPNLMPEKTIDYALGFQQVLSSSSSLKLETFYREMRDMVTAISYRDAYPATYTSYDNLDFGTVKGVTMTYDLRQTKNLWMKASYTLQFASGTGSNANSNLSLIRAGKENLRTTVPLSYDQRHAIVGTIDYHFQDKEGPTIKGKHIFQNFGVNLQMQAGSGEPYSKQTAVTGAALITPVGSALLDGSLYGSRLPWQFKADMQIDKSFTIRNNSEKGRKPMNMNVYCQILNLFNATNINSVYGYTGNPDDDGYLTDPTFQNDINSTNDPESFREQYTMAVNNPFNYLLPRRIRIGLRLDF